MGPEQSTAGTRGVSNKNVEYKQARNPHGVSDRTVAETHYLGTYLSMVLTAIPIVLPYHKIEHW